MKKYVAIILLLPYMAEASWMEFCHLSGRVISDVQEYERGLKFQLKVEEAKKFSKTKGELYFSSYTDCQRHVGKVYEVFYSDQEYSETGKPKKGESHCVSYTVEDGGGGAPVYWVPGCSNG